MCPRACCVARYTASGSMPSTFQLRMPKPGPRPDSRGSAVTSDTWVETAYRLFSTKKHKGSDHAAARLKLSSVDPMLIAPSPKNVKVTASVPAFLWAHADPA